MLPGIELPNLMVLYITEEPSHDIVVEVKQRKEILIRQSFRGPETILRFTIPENRRELIASAIRPK